MAFEEARLKTLFDKKYEFRFATRKDIPNIMQYIDVAWKEGHILSKDRELFEYEYCEKNSDRVHFLLAINRANGDIEGLIGFYYTSARRAYKDFDVWGSMWSVRKDHYNLPMLGIQLASEYYRQLGSRYEIGLGVNAVTAAPLLKDCFAAKIGKMNHYYLLNDLEEFRLAKIIEYKCDKKSHKDHDLISNYKLVYAQNIDEVKKKFDFDKQIVAAPYKDAWYVDHRFFSHPVYKYEVYMLCRDNNKADALMVMRRVWHNERCALRIMDYMGDISALKNVSALLYSLMDSSTEYIDFYNYGYDSEEIIKAGFCMRVESDPNIIPNYFEPFERKNIDIWFNSDAKGDFVICKADADQDRPNIKQVKSRSAIYKQTR